MCSGSRRAGAGEEVSDSVEPYDIHCRYCAAINTIRPDVYETRCHACGEVIATKMTGDETLPRNPLTAIADRTGNVLRVTCAHCQFVNEFPGMDMVFIFLCHQCGEPVAVEEPRQ